MFGRKIIATLAKLLHSVQSSLQTQQQLTPLDKTQVKLLHAEEITLHVSHLNNSHPANSTGYCDSLWGKIRRILNLCLVCPLQVKCWTQHKGDAIGQEVNLGLFFSLCKSQTYPSRLAASNVFQLMFY